MIRRQAIIASPEGLHARPANEFAKLASAVPGKVMVSRLDGESVRGDSMLSLMTLGLRTGEMVLVEISDDSQETLLEELIRLLSAR
jgi:phosphotransferase system HPr (HPr) family protein